MSDLDRLRNASYEFIQHYVDDIYGVVSSPRLFFRLDKEKNGFLEPSAFAAFNILIPKLFYALLLAPLTLGFSLLTVLPSVLYGCCTLFIAAIVIYGLLRYAGGKENFETAYRNVAYSSVAYYAWLIPVPFLNLLLFTAAYCALLYFAFREVHELEPQRAMFILILPAFLILLMGAILSIITLWILIGGAWTLFHYFYA